MLSGDGAFSAKMESAFLRAMGKGTKELVHVDMAEKLGHLGLLPHFPAIAWPATNSVRELATKLKKLEKEGSTDAFVFVELKKCVIMFHMCIHITCPSCVFFCL